MVDLPAAMMQATNGPMKIEIGICQGFRLLWRVREEAYCSSPDFYYAGDQAAAERFVKKCQEADRKKCEINPTEYAIEPVLTVMCDRKCYLVGAEVVPSL